MWFNWNLALSLLIFLIVVVLASLSVICFAWNQSCSEISFISLNFSLLLVWRSIRETNSLHISVQDLFILHQLGFSSKPPKLPKLLMSTGLLPHLVGSRLTQMVMLMELQALVVVRRRGGCSSHDFVKGFFAFGLDIIHAFEAELWAVFIAIDFARQFSWDHIWLEADSSYVVLLFMTRSLEVPWYLRARWSQCIQYFIDSFSCFSYFSWRQSSRGFII